ncbi:MAG: hypothetical protein OEU93_17360, partial [Rubrivivax sp.]|nr:hypothetical protein [Rubrivivax sp.]
ARVTVNPVHLEHSLRHIQSVRRRMHLWTSALLGVAVGLPLWHTNPTTHAPFIDGSLRMKEGVHSISVGRRPAANGR